MSAMDEEKVSTPLRPDNVISQKILNILSKSYVDSDVRLALLSLDDRITSNTVEARRDLRSNTEGEVIKNNGLILKDFSRIAGKLSELGDMIDQLNTTYRAMDQLVTTAHRSTSHILQESNDLRVQAEKNAGKQVIVQAFESTFVVTEAEAEILASSAVPVDDNFFSTLAKVKRVHEDCKALMASDDNQEVGMEIMQQMSGHLEKAYSKLHRSVLQDFKSLSGTNVQIGKILRRKLNVLVEEPLLFDTAMTGLSETRQRNLQHEFVKALTTEKDNTKPLDFYAYDALRYIGGIMAWIHSAAVNERENLETLFEYESAKDEPWSRQINPREIVENQVDKITGSLTKPLRSRVEQVLAAESKATVIYQAYHVLSFYKSTFLKHFDEKAEVIVALTRLEEAAMRQFSSRLEDRIKAVAEHIDPSEDLQPPEYLSEAIADLKTCLASYESSMSYSPSGDDSIRQIVHDMVEPYLECCSRAASDMSAGDAEIFLINCYDAVKMTLSLYSFTQYKVDQLDSRINELADVLEETQYRSFLNSSGITTHTNLEDKEVVKSLSVSLDEFLPAATMESNQFLYQLSSPRLASTISLRASQRFADEFARIDAKLHEIHSDLSPEEFKLMFFRSLEEVRVLLAID